MSEYQYYEFQTIDRPLTAKEQAEIKKLSSRVQLTPTQAIFLYNYGDFRSNPEKVLTQYFDVMFYIANWGTWRLMFRFLKRSLTRIGFSLMTFPMPSRLPKPLITSSLTLKSMRKKEYGVGLKVKDGYRAYCYYAMICCGGFAPAVFGMVAGGSLSCWRCIG